MTIYPYYRYALMLRCWEADYDERFSFKIITEKLSVATGKNGEEN